jgi:Trk K+ transport system NAD-binding subunit
VANLDAALLVRELAPRLRIVVRMFDEVLAESVDDLVANCTVLSATAVAAPAFVAAAVDGDAPTPLRLFDRAVYVADRDQVPPGDVICGLADTDGRGAPIVLPTGQNSADLVLAASVRGSDVDAADTRAPSGSATRRHLRRRAVLGLLELIARRLRLVVMGLLIIVAISTAVLTRLAHVNLWHGFYLAVLATIGGVDPDLSASTSLQILHIVFALLSIAMIPLVTATVVDAVVSARLALANGGLVGPIDSHIVVIGLGDLGTRVLTRLDDLGVPVVAVDRDPDARGVEVARQRHIPVIVGDATRREILSAASVHTSRSLVVLTSSDLANVQAALLARRASPHIPSVMRLFDTDFADRIQKTFPFTTSRSVSALAAPSFAAAILGHEVVATIPVHRRVLLAAEVPVEAGSALEGETIEGLQREGEIRIIAIRTGRGDQVLWTPPPGRQLTRTDTLLAITNRRGLGRLIQRSTATGDPRPLAAFDRMPIRSA